MRWSRAWVLATALACAPVLTGANNVTLTADQLRNAAAESLRVGKTGQALQFADALVERNPDDRIALLIRARALRDSGAYGDARTSARRAWSLSETDGEKYASAMIMAQALSSDGKRTRAQLWLRRAHHAAPSPTLARKAAQDFRYVRMRNPWSTRLSFSIAPNSNINNGSANERSFLNHDLSRVLFGQPVEYQLSGTALALSGIEYNFDVATRYRFAQTQTRAHDLRAMVDLRLFSLSSDAKATAPTARASDYSFADVAVGYTFRQINFDGRGELQVDADLGQSWYGGSPYARYVRLGAGQSYRLTPQLSLNGSLTGELQSADLPHDVDLLRASVASVRTLDSGAQMRLSLSAASTYADRRDAEYQELTLEGRFALPRPVMGTRLNFGLGAQARRYDTTPHGPAGRSDDKLFADVSVTFVDVDYYGFNPSVTLYAAQTDSNIGLYETRRFGLNIGIRSAF